MPGGRGSTPDAIVANVQRKACEDGAVAPRPSDDQLIGVSRSAAARVIGITERRLVAWNNRGLVYPSAVSQIGRRTIWTFSLEDLVQGRVVRELEDRGIHVRHIRHVVEAVRSSVHPRPLASLRWGVAGHEVFVGYPDGSWVGDRHPNQQVLIETLDLKAIRGEARRAAQQRPKAAAGAVESRRGSLGSKEVFAGTRIPVAAVVEYVRRGASDRRILQGFPDLGTEDVAYARQLAG